MNNRDDDQNTSLMPFIVDNMSEIGELGSRAIDIGQQAARNVGVDWLLDGNNH